MGASANSSITETKRSRFLIFAINMVSHLGSESKPIAWIASADGIGICDYLIFIKSVMTANRPVLIC